ncbi:MAG: hypothetical protein JNL07_03845 [Rhodospirillales bacterium]|nr:hypothetical protein [Rhodospirillales bacterium]
MKLKLALPAVALSAGLAACGGPSAEERAVARTACPEALRVQDATTLTRFRAGPGRDPTDIVFTAELGKTQIACDPGANRVDIDLKLEVIVVEGPAAARARQASVGYFVRVLNPAGRVVQGRNFTSDFQFARARARQGSSEEITLRIPLAAGEAGGAYSIAVGLLPTPEELEFNRSGGAARR